jgi:hypothetical protein
MSAPESGWLCVIGTPLGWCPALITSVLSSGLVATVELHDGAELGRPGEALPDVYWIPRPLMRLAPRWVVAELGSVCWASPDAARAALTEYLLMPPQQVARE